MNEKEAIATGISSLNTESRINCPIPGQENIVSVSTEPSIIVTIVNIKDVTTGSKAFLAACLSLILFWEIPFALAVNIKSSFITSIIVVLVNRAVPANATTVTVNTGSIM